MRRYVQTVISTFPSFNYAKYRGLCSAYVVDTIQTVFYHFFRSRNFEDCVVNTVNQGGDADTAGAIMGAMAGAYYGLEQIPDRWVKKLDPRLVTELRELARAMVARSPLAVLPRF